MNTKKLGFFTWLSSFASMLLLAGSWLVMFLAREQENINWLLLMPIFLVPLIAFSVVQIVIWSKYMDNYRRLMKYYKWKRKKLWKEKDLVFISLTIGMGLTGVGVILQYVFSVIYDMDQTIMWISNSVFWILIILTFPIQYFKIHKITDDEIEQFLLSQPIVPMQNVSQQTPAQQNETQNNDSSINKG